MVVAMRMRYFFLRTGYRGVCALAIAPVFFARQTARYFVGNVVAGSINIKFDASLIATWAASGHRCYPPCGRNEGRFDKVRLRRLMWNGYAFRYVIN
jgi:hypothetical protein